MSANGLLQIALFLGVLIALAKPLGWYMARVYEGKLPAFVRWMAPIENLFYRLCGVDSKQEMRWTRYALAMLWFALARCAGSLCDAAPAGHAAAESAGIRRGQS